MKTYDMQAREWLNPMGSSDTGSIDWSVVAEVYDSGKGMPFGVDADLCIRDCLRVVTLDMSFYTEDKYRQRLDKVDLLIKHLLRMREALVEARKCCLFVNYNDNSVGGGSDER